MHNLFQGIFDSTTQSTIEPLKFVLCIVVALVIGAFLAFVYTYKSHYTQSFVITLILLPSIVCVVIMMVNGNIGAGVAVAGTFSLVRFRSVPGSAKDIGTIFLAMGAGLVAGMGYLAYAVLFTVILGVIMVVCNQVSFMSKNNQSKERTLRITIPEDLNYTEIFDDLMEQYTQRMEVVSVKTTNMGSLFKLTYNVTLKDALKEKEFIDALRCRNGNLEISMSKQETGAYEL